MARQAGLFDIDEPLAALSAKGDVLEKLTSKAFGQFWNALATCRRSSGGRLPFDHVLKLKRF